MSSELVVNVRPKDCYKCEKTILSGEEAVHVGSGGRAINKWFHRDCFTEGRGRRIF